MEPSKKHRRMETVLEAIGNTPLIRLNKLTKGLESEVWVKPEFMNPSGSIKDRIAIYMLDKAEREGKLKPGGTIVENTSGNTGQSIGIVAAVKGYNCIFTMPDKMSQEKADGMKAYGAKVVVTPTNVPADSPKSYYETAIRIHRELPGSFYLNQYHSKGNTEAHYFTGKEIWEQTEGKVTHLVAGVGTFGTFAGIAKYLKEQNPDIKCIGVDPEGSVFYNIWKTGDMGEPFVYKVEGMGEDMITGNMDMSLVDEIIQVNDKQCFNTGRRLCREEGLFAGGSSGGAVDAALEVARKAPKGSVIVTILPDSGSRYLSKMYRDEWMRDNDLLEEPARIGVVADLTSHHTRRSLITVKKNEKIAAVIQKMKENGISQLPVFENGSVLGLVHEVDLLNLMLSGAGNANSAIEAIIQTDYPQVAEDATLDEVSEMFTESSCEAVMVTKENKAVNIITKIDLIDFLLQRSANGKN